MLVIGVDNGEHVPLYQAEMILIISIKLSISPGIGRV